MIALQITATTPHGVVLSRPWGVALDGLLASVLWHRRKWAARAAGKNFTYQHNETPETLDLPLARCGDPDRDADWHWMATFADLHPRPHDAVEPDIRWRTSRTDRHRLQHLSPVIGSQAVSDRTGRNQRRVVPVMAHPVTTLTWRTESAIRTASEICSPNCRPSASIAESARGWSPAGRSARLPHVPDWEAGHEHEPGVLGRTAPPRCVDEPRDAGLLGAATVRPPYLHPASRTAAYQPSR